MYSTCFFEGQEEKNRDKYTLWYITKHHNVSEALIDLLRTLNVHMLHH